MTLFNFQSNPWRQGLFLSSSFFQIRRLTNQRGEVTCFKEAGIGSQEIWFWRLCAFTQISRLNSRDAKHPRVHLIQTPYSISGGNWGPAGENNIFLNHGHFLKKVHLTNIYWALTNTRPCASCCRCAGVSLFFKAKNPYPNETCISGRGRLKTK